MKVPGSSLNSSEELPSCAKRKEELRTDMKSHLLVTTSKALVTTSEALVTSSILMSSC